MWCGEVMPSEHAQGMLRWAHRVEHNRIPACRCPGVRADPEPIRSSPGLVRQPSPTPAVPPGPPSRTAACECARSPPTGPSPSAPRTNCRMPEASYTGNRTVPPHDRHPYSEADSHRSGVNQSLGRPDRSKDHPVAAPTSAGHAHREPCRRTPLRRPQLLRTPQPT